MNTSSLKPQTYNNQVYEKIRDDCVKEHKRLWEDTTFPPIYDSRSDWEWKRPKEIVTNPKFIKTHIKTEPSRFNSKDLNLSNSKSKEIIQHNVAVLSAITLNLRIFRSIVPEDNVEFSDSNYVGLFHFRFYRYGKLYDIVIDDRLPTQGGKLVSFLKDDNPVEFWPFLLEKAYTKLFGVGESVSKTPAPDFIVDLSGGVSETYVFLGHSTELPIDMENDLNDASERGSYIIFSKHSNSNSENLNLKDVYCVTKSIFVDGEDTSENILLMKIFTPFETETKEWKGGGPWSENSPEWKTIPEAKINDMGVTNKFEFWMPFTEFSKHDWNIYIVHLNPQQIEHLNIKNEKCLTWNLSSFEGKWVRGVSSGGNRRENSSNAFYLNPQYSLSCAKPDSENIEDNTIIVSVLQKTHRCSRIPINIYVFQLTQKSEDRLGWDFFKHNIPIIDGYPHEDTRELTRRFKITPGEYCIVTATNKPQDEANFFLRVLAEKNVTVDLIRDHVVHKDVDVRVSITPKFLEHESVQESDKQVDYFFDQVSGEDKVVGWKGLKKVLDYAMDREKPSKSDNNYAVKNSLLSYILPSSSVFDTMECREFSKDLARSLLAMADYDHSGKLSLHEFQGLWAQVRQWIKIYEMYSDEYGYLPKESLREALDSAGFQLSSDILGSLAVRYSNRDNMIPFDDFLMCASKLRTVFDYYKFKDPENTNQAVFTLEEWLQKSIYS